MIKEVSVSEESTPPEPEPAETEPAATEPVLEPAPEVRGRSPHVLEPAEPEEPPSPGSEASVPPAQPVPQTRVPPRVKPKAKPKAEPSQVLASSSSAKPKAKRAPKKTEVPAEEMDRFASFSNTDLMSEMLKRTDGVQMKQNTTLHCSLIAEIIARSNDHRMEEKRSMYRSFLQ